MNKFRWILGLSTLTLALTAGCTTTTPVGNAYTRVIDTYSDGDVEYEGAYNNFKFRATMMNEPVQVAYIDKKAEIYLWDPIKRQNELTKLQADNGKTTTIFMSFFTPLRQDDNLSTPKSIWSVYLQTSRGRFEGTAVKNRDNRTELYTMFPYHQRYSTGYTITFSIPVNQVENEETTVLVAGPLGQKTIKFPARKVE